MGINPNRLNGNHCIFNLDETEILQNIFRIIILIPVEKIPSLSGKRIWHGNRETLRRRAKEEFVERIGMQEIKVINKWGKEVCVHSVSI